MLDTVWLMEISTTIRYSLLVGGVHQRMNASFPPSLGSTWK
jgi:hypothetical protein